MCRDNCGHGMSIAVGYQILGHRAIADKWHHFHNKFSTQPTLFVEEV
jgi:hypothetical protein